MAAYASGRKPATTVGGIIAAGLGSRMRSAGCSKALLEIDGKPLIAHVLEQFLEAQISELVVVVRSEDLQLRDYLKSVSRRGYFERIRVLGVKSGAGTGFATRHLMMTIGPRDHLLSTVDLIAPRRLAVDLCHAGEQYGETALCVLATTPYLQDEAPVWVGHRPSDQAVETFGKDSRRSPDVFGNIRWVSGRAIRRIWREAKFWRAKRDTEIVRLLIKSAPGAVRARRFGIIYDVDRAEDVVAANEWLSDAREFDRESPTQQMQRVIGDELIDSCGGAGQRLFSTQSAFKYRALTSSSRIVSRDMRYTIALSLPGQGIARPRC